ncbi:MAG: phosphoribosylanthranilate isomerase [Oscillospiraceae bacterium]|jgi:phosphoribosylanthranilate isomerase|nr:phosphoribosylanthranilate isomerase [Oscillospiraceae bacterium]
MSKVKICGLSREADIAAVNRVLPDFIGFVFAQSRRRVDVKTAAMLKEKLDPRIGAVGVFVNENIGVIGEMYKSGIIDLAQLHGDEDGGYISRLKELCGCPVIKAVGLGDTLPSLPSEPDYLLFDTISKQRGGLGKTFDWNCLKGYSGLPYFLAGGLSIENVADSINILDPFCVDVSSGVETNGAKDPEKIEKFVYVAVHGVSGSLFF